MFSKRIPSEQVSCHDAYTKKYLPITTICRTEDELVNEINNYELDAIIVGSDALFKYIPENNRRHFSKRRLRYVSHNILSVLTLDGNPFFGGFATKLNKKFHIAAFSVSSQNCAYEDMSGHEKAKMKEALANYDYITVRDEWTKSMVESIMGVSGIQVTPDPVFSFNQNCYFQLPSKEDVINKYHLQEKYVLISYSTWYNNATYINSIAQEVKKAGYMPVAFPMPEKLFSAGITNQVNLPLSPLDWYSLIKYSSGYIGERMHPIVVCLHNAVPFFCFDEYGVYRKSYWGLYKSYIKESSKIYDILNKAGLTQWMYSYSAHDKCPSPELVMKALMRFDINRCAQFSNNYQLYYEEMMSKLLNDFINYK